MYMQTYGSLFLPLGKKVFGRANVKFDMYYSSNVYCEIYVWQDLTMCSK